MRRRLILVVLAALLVLGLAGALLHHRPLDDEHGPSVAARAHDRRPAPDGNPRGPRASTLLDPDDPTVPPMFDVLPAHRVVQDVARRFHGRLIALALVRPDPTEAARGVDLVYVLRLLTPARDVLEIRVDARAGTFLELRGRDLAAARRRP